MSALIFPHARGLVKRVMGPGQVPPSFSINIQGLGFRDRAIVTQIGVVQNGNFQFLHTLSDQVFVYVFGDRISELQVSGISFGSYGGHQSFQCLGERSGTTDVFNFYKNRKISQRSQPLLIRIGAMTVFRGFLTGMNFEVTDPETLLGQFSFRFHSFPTAQ
jgi:hypothetical protein